MILRKDSWVRNMSRSEEGREFLKALSRLNQTDADEDKIHKLKEKGGI